MRSRIQLRMLLCVTQAAKKLQERSFFEAQKLNVQRIACVIDWSVGCKTTTRYENFNFFVAFIVHMSIIATKTTPSHFKRTPGRFPSPCRSGQVGFLRTLLALFFEG